jgi:adenosylhomocysteine nucleosidase
MAIRFPKTQNDVLICFAVEEEAKFFPQGSRGLLSRGPHLYETLVTGIGRKNAAEHIRRALPIVRPRVVLSCGFAGGLNPDLALGDIVFDEDYEVGLTEMLEELGCSSGRFHCAKRVAVTAEEKHRLWQSTAADAVEMESSVIRTICREFRIPSATIRVISDTAHEDLPLDFNVLMTSDDRINYAKLAWAILSSPRKIPKLMDFQRQTIIASRRLASILEQLAKAGIC